MSNRQTSPYSDKSGRSSVTTIDTMQYVGMAPTLDHGRRLELGRQVLAQASNEVEEFRRRVSDPRSVSAYFDMAERYRDTEPEFTRLLMRAFRLGFRNYQVRENLKRFCW